jgi:hypothetical protein
MISSQITSLSRQREPKKGHALLYFMEIPEIWSLLGSASLIANSENRSFLGDFFNRKELKEHKEKRTRSIKAADILQHLSLCVLWISAARQGERRGRFNAGAWRGRSGNQRT